MASVYSEEDSMAAVEARQLGGTCACSCRVIGMAAGLAVACGSSMWLESQ